MKAVTLANDSSRALLMTGSLLLTCLIVFAVLVWSQNMGAMKLIYPGAMVVVAGALYVARPAFYLGFCWWIWFISPFVRRVIDYDLGAHDPTNPVMLAPYLVASFSLITFLRFGGRLRQRRYFPFLLSILGVLYGFLVGIVGAGILSATFGVLQWLVPLLMGLHVLLLWQEYPEHRQVVRTTFTWGILLMGLYGIYQFVSPPVWDADWLLQSGMVDSMGKPNPYNIRIFSTLNATGPFAIITMVGLLLLFDGRGLMTPIAAVPGYVALMLTLVRAAWGGWLVALAFLALRVQGHVRVRLMAFLLVGLGLAVPLMLFSGPMSDHIGTRIDTVGSIESDNSFQARMGLYARESSRVVTSVLGEGIGSFGTAAKLNTGSSVNFDSGVLQIPITLGWLGTLLYIGGLVMMLLRVWQIREAETDRFAVIAASIVMALMALLLFQNQLVGLSGMVVWSFLGLALSAEAYYEEE